MSNRIFFLFQAITAIFLLNLISASTASSSSYEIEKTVIGVSGGNASSSSYSLVTTSSSTGNNFSSTSYQGSSDPFTNVNASSSDSGSGSSSTGTGSASSGSRGGGSTEESPRVSSKGITISDENIHVKLKQGEVVTKKIKIRNDDTKTLKINLENQRLSDFVIIKEPAFSLSPGQSKEIGLEILVTEDTIPNIYLGKVVVKTEYGIKEIFVAIEVESKSPLLDVRAEIQADYLQILPGEYILAEIRLFNLGDSKGDVEIEYTLKDFNGNEISKEIESLAIETQADFVKKINIPADANYGKYVLYIRTTYSGKVASASDEFEVVQYKVSSREKIFIIAIVLLIIILSMVIYYFIQERTKPFRKIMRKVGMEELVRNRA